MIVYFNNFVSSVQNFRQTKTWQRILRHMFSYTILMLGASFMLFPMLWMLSSSLKPSWQIFTDPPIWIPHHWEEVRAGNTNRMINLWRVEMNGEPTKVIEIGLRRYTTVIDATQLKNLQMAPTDELSEASTTTLGELVLNVRTWTTEGKIQQVVALARGEDDQLVVATADDLQSAALRMPLDEVNSGDRARFEVEGIEFRGREIETESGSLKIIPIGPESQLTVVAAPEIASAANLVPGDSLSDAGFAPVGRTELPLVTVAGQSGDYINFATESWQPIIDQNEFDANVFIAPRADLLDEKEVLVNDVSMRGATYTPKNGEPLLVAILLSGNIQSAVIPVDEAATLQLAYAGGLNRTHGGNIERIPFRAQDDFILGEEDEPHSVVLVGDTREMALVAPVSIVDNAFDVNPNQLERAMHVRLRFGAYQEALDTRVGDTQFPTFFRNSFILVILNIVGHVISCVVVAYAFARLRAPGKNFFFVILLGTMMLPYPVTLVPVYEIFRDLGMINTLWPLFLRAFFGNAFFIFMLRQFFSTIPLELEEAARIDGANVVQIILRVIVPLSKPAIATVVIFTFWWTWNSFFEPFIYLSSPSLFPVSVGLNFFKDQYVTIYYDRLIAASLMSMVPMIVLFFFAQRYFIEGIQLTGMKS